MNKTKVCQYCNKEIAKTADICPGCGARQKKPIYIKGWFWIIIAVIVIGIIGAISGGDSDTQVKKNTASENVAQQNPDNSVSSGGENDKAYNIGDVITTDKFEIKVNSVETRKSVGGEYFSQTPSDGGVYVVVSYEVKNISDEPISAFLCPSVKLEDSGKITYDSDIGASSYYATEANLDTKIVSDLNPGITVKDAEVFEISEESYNAGGFSVYIDAGEKISVPIN